MAATGSLLACVENCGASRAASRSNTTTGSFSPSETGCSLGLSGSKIVKKPSKPPGCGSRRGVSWEAPRRQVFLGVGDRCFERKAAVV